MNRLLLLAMFFSAACGSSSNQQEDAGIADAAPGEPDAFADCGDSLTSGAEQCDDGNASEEDTCLNDCMLACGDGERNASELCDTAIPVGSEGACPEDCNDGNACTSDVVAEDGCQTICLNSTISSFIDGDGCCPDGANNSLDADCPAVCDNAVVESGETCDTAIASANVGACPIDEDCDDGIACTVDELVGDGTCAAQCENTAIDAVANDDGCCPSRASAATDNDCPAGCGDGIISPAETCDTAIADSCPIQADCVDGNACTQDILLSAGTCSAVCEHPAISAPSNGDGCCPAGANANNDDDCAPVCGNGVAENSEQCDDGGTIAGDGCDANCQQEVLSPTAFRLTSVQLREPHAFAKVFICVDVTTEVFGIPGINETFDNTIAGDKDVDGLLDLSVVQVFRPLDQAQGSNVLEAHDADCTSPMDTTTCTTGIPPTILVATNQSTGTCLEPIAGTTGPGNTGTYSPAPISPSAPCYSTNTSELTLNVDGMVITLRDARFAASYVGVPATSMVNGLLTGFLRETDADIATIPLDVDFVGGSPLSSVLPGGTGCCKSGSSSAMDVGPGGSAGWWMALNFSAEAVPWND